MRNFWLLTLFLWLHAKDLQFSQFKYSCFLPYLIFNWFFFSLPQTIKSGSGIMNLGGSLTRQVLNECIYENTFVLPIWLCLYHVWSWHTCGVDMHLHFVLIQRLQLVIELNDSKCKLRKVKTKERGLFYQIFLRGFRETGVTLWYAFAQHALLAC